MIAHAKGHHVELVWPKHGRRDKWDRLVWRCRNRRRYKVVKSSPAGLATVYYALVLYDDRWEPCEESGGRNLVKRYRTKAAALRACQRHYRKPQRVFVPMHDRVDVDHLDEVFRTL